MFGRLALNASRRHPLLFSKRAYNKTPYWGAPPMRHMSFAKQVAAFLWIFAAGSAYPTWFLLNLDHIRPKPANHFTDELKEQLAERRRLRAEGKLNVLQQKVTPPLAN